MTALVEVEVEDAKPTELDGNHVSTVQEILSAISDLPGVMEKIDAYMRGRGIEDPQAEIGELRSVVF